MFISSVFLNITKTMLKMLMARVVLLVIYKELNGLSVEGRKEATQMSE